MQNDAKLQKRYCFNNSKKKFSFKPKANNETKDKLFWKMKEGNKCYSCTFSLTKRVAMQRKKLENNKEKLINLSQNYRKLLLNEITIPNRKLLLQKKTSMGIQFVESMPVFFSKFSN